MERCPHCGGPGGAAVCASCGRPIPRFYSEAVRDLAFAPAEGEWEAETHFDRSAAERAVRKLTSDLAEGALDLEAYQERLGAIEAFLNEVLSDHDQALDRARAPLTRVPEERERFEEYEQVTAALLQRAADGFGAALTEMALFPEDGEAARVETAAAAAGEAMDALADLDRHTEALEGWLRGRAGASPPAPASPDPAPVDQGLPAVEPQVEQGPPLLEEAVEERHAEEEAAEGEPPDDLVG